MLFALSRGESENRRDRAFFRPSVYALLVRQEDPQGIRHLRF